MNVDKFATDYQLLRIATPLARLECVEGVRQLVLSAAISGIQVELIQEIMKQIDFANGNTKLLKP